MPHNQSEGVLVLCLVVHNCYLIRLPQQLPELELYTYINIEQATDLKENLRPERLSCRDVTISTYERHVGKSTMLARGSANLTKENIFLFIILL